jgi:hypothetical protein
LHLEVKSTLKIELVNRNIGEPHLEQFFFREAQIWWLMFVNWLVSLCMSSLGQNLADSFAAEGGERTYTTSVFRDLKYL